jgi:hypothetical protein
MTLLAFPLQVLAQTLNIYLLVLLVRVLQSLLQAGASMVAGGMAY